MVVYRFAQKNIQPAVFDLPNLHAFIVPQYAIAPRGCGGIFQGRGSPFSYNSISDMRRSPAA